MAIPTGITSFKFPADLAGPMHAVADYISHDRFFMAIASFSCLVVLTVGGQLLQSAWSPFPVPDIALVENYKPLQSIQIFDRKDKAVSFLPAEEDRKVVPLKRISTHMQKAILAAEDRNFYNHNGISPAGIIRATIANLQAGRIVEGGSTITQQLVKNLYFKDTKRTLQRKIKEAYIAWQVERRVPKDKILEAYLNEVYFGNGAHGVERAANRYFGKSAMGLSPAESAFLASLVKAPSQMSRVENRPVALARQKNILSNMAELGFLTPDQAKRARAQELAFKKEPQAYQRHPYYISYIHDLLKQRFTDEQMFREGLKVYTNMDQDAQGAAERALSDGIRRAPRGVRQAALVSVSVKDGGVVALVGGVGDYWKHQWNRATSVHTAGSAFKPFVYLAALRHGVLTPDTFLEDEPLTIMQVGAPPYSPKNFDEEFMGIISIRRALALSRNTCAVRVGQMVGMDKVVDTAKLAGITSRLDPYPSLALGSSAISPLEMAGAFSTLARSGVAIDPWLVRRIENREGQPLHVFKPESKKVFPDEPVAQLVDVLQEAVSSGTGTQARLPNRPVAGKTGTADQSKDIWFIGFTPDLVTAVWGGNDENNPIPGSHVTGGGVMARMWRQYNIAYYAKHPTPAGYFKRPQERIKEIDDFGMLAEFDGWFNSIPDTVEMFLGSRRTVRQWQPRTVRPEVAIDRDNDDSEDEDDNWREYRGGQQKEKRKLGIVRRIVKFLKDL